MINERSYVLVHGAWHGGWCWGPVKRILEADGETVFAPTLTGLGERAHIREPVPSLETHIKDVVALIEAEELSRVVLVGHSYAGMVITAVADRLRAKIDHLVYLDGAVPGDGSDLASHAPGMTREEAQQRRAAFQRMAPDGAWLAPPPPEAVGVTGEDAAWLRRRLTPHPLRTWLEPVQLIHGGIAGLRKTYVLATQPLTTIMGYPAQGAAAKADPEWSYREIACGHNVMVAAPERTADLILEAGRS